MRPLTLHNIDIQLDRRRMVLNISNILLQFLVAQVDQRELLLLRPNLIRCVDLAAYQALLVRAVPRLRSLDVWFYGLIVVGLFLFCFLVLFKLAAIINIFF